jgi:hypothetical protein
VSSVVCSARRRVAAPARVVGAGASAPARRPRVIERVVASRAGAHRVVVAREGRRARAHREARVERSGARGAGVATRDMAARRARGPGVTSNSDARDGRRGEQSGDERKAEENMLRVSGDEARAGRVRGDARGGRGRGVQGED